VRALYPLSSIVGQEDLKLSLLLAAIDPTIGGVLIRGERGTGKSTAARALAALLPEQSGRAAPFMELPLGATEDRIVGSLDIAQALKEGRSQLRPGLLAQANGGVLYVDEVNLLPDHIVDLLLDAASSGWVTVEREGLSTGQAARFILVGTMNPEEGGLRPQFLDRFGLCVDVKGLDGTLQRITAVRQRMAFDDAPSAFLEAAQTEEDALRTAVLTARSRLQQVSFSDEDLALMAELAVQREAIGIRGDLAGIKSARALAAWEGADTVTPLHLHRVADMALSHRTPRRPRAPRRGAQPLSAPASGSVPGQAPGHSWPASRQGPTEAPRSAGPSPQQAQSPDSTPRHIDLVTDRSPLDSLTQVGPQSLGSAQRVIGTRRFEGTAPLAVRETWATAVHRGAQLDSHGLQLQSSDLRQQKREPGEIWQVLFLVDASGSMGAGRRLEAAREIALGLLASSYRRRDEVALMIFRGESADLVLPFTRDSRRLEDTLRALPVGGRTPLAGALHEAARVLSTRQPALLVLFTDGRANVVVRSGDPWVEALDACEAVVEACAGILVIDCESGPVVLGRAQQLAQALRATCLSLESADVNEVVVHLRGRLERL
jgi:magnesium chelatase subunit D